MVAEVTEELKHKMEVYEVHTVEVLVPMRNWCDSLTMVVSTTIW